jgi:hypothetical protein
MATSKPSQPPPNAPAPPANAHTALWLIGGLLVLVVAAGIGYLWPRGNEPAGDPPATDLTGKPEDKPKPKGPGAEKKAPQEEPEKQPSEKDEPETEELKNLPAPVPASGLEKEREEGPETEQLKNLPKPVPWPSSTKEDEEGETEQLKNLPELVPAPKPKDAPR